MLGEEVEPVLEVVLAAARHLHALALGACAWAGHDELSVSLSGGWWNETFVSLFKTCAALEDVFFVCMRRAIKLDLI